MTAQLFDAVVLNEYICYSKVRHKNYCIFVHTLNISKFTSDMLCLLLA